MDKLMIKKESGDDVAAGKLDISSRTPSINKSVELWNNHSHKPQSEQLSIPFVANAIDACNPRIAGFGSCSDILVAVAKVFAFHGDTVTLAEWDSLFWEKAENEKNILSEELLHLITDAYRRELDYQCLEQEHDDSNDDNIATYKGVCDRVRWICKPNTPQQIIFARYLLKLCDARHGSMQERRLKVLGMRIASLGKFTPKFQHRETWKKTIALPQSIQSYFIGTGGLVHDTDDEDYEDLGDADKIQLREAGIQSGLRTLAWLQAKLYKLRDENIHTTHVKNSSQLLQDLQNIKQTLASVAVNVHNMQEASDQDRLTHAAITSSFESLVVLQDTLGADAANKIIDLVRGFWRALHTTPTHVNAMNFAKDVVQTLGFSEDRVMFNNDDGGGGSGSCETSSSSSHIITNTTAACWRGSPPPPPLPALTDSDDDVLDNNYNRGTRKRVHGKMCAITVERPAGKVGIEETQAEAKRGKIMETDNDDDNMDIEPNDGKRVLLSEPYKSDLHTGEVYTQNTFSSSPEHAF